MRKYYHLSLLLICLLGITLTSQAQTPSPMQRKQKNRIVPPASRQNEERIRGSFNSGAHKYKSAKFSLHDSLKLKARKSKGGTPLIIRGNPGKRKAKLSTREDVMQSVQDYLSDISASTGINPSDFRIIDIDDDQLGHKHVKLQQKHLGIDIYAAEVIVHFKNNEPHLFNGRYHKNTGLTDVAPVFSSAYAIGKALDNVKTETTVMDFTPAQRQLLEYNAPGSELVIYQVPGESTFNLAWHISIRPNMLELWDYFVNAKTGAIIMKYNHTCSSGPATTTSTDLNGQSRTINSYLVGSTYVMIDASKAMYNAAASTIPSDPVGAIWTLDAQNTDLQSVVQVTSSNNTWSANATSAHYNAGVCYDYYKNTHSRISLDGDSGTIISVINVTQGGQPMDNAYWNGKFMAYGNGNVAFSPLAGGLDVAAHEMTHGVISHTANLEYYQQSGAINESMADIFGCMVDRNDWQIGEDVSSSIYFPSGALRDVSDPHNGGTSSNYYWQPRVMSEYVNTSADNGGVHTNSGIPNYAFYLFASDASMGKSKAEQVYYRALTHYLVRSSQFIDLRLAVVQAATDLYGTTEANAAKAAFDAVGILDGTGGDYQNDVPVNSGQDYMLLKNTFSGDPNSLYLIDFAGSSIDPLTTNSVSERPSVTDNGSYAFFATGAGNVKRVNMDPASPSLTTIVSTTDWTNVAVSKDGSKLAMISKYQDTAIYVYDINTTSLYSFQLYNPTYTDGIVTDGPIYADMVEWDITGEYIIYDCYNKVENDTSNIDYWDIGILKAWDNSTDSPGDGNIQKVFTDLPAGVSVGNPTFSKNSPYIIAFDYIADNGDGTYDYYVLGYNIETGDVGVIIQNVTLGFPSYSPDDFELAFSSYDNTPVPTIFRIGLDADKINSITAPVGVVQDAEIPVWFAKGNRTTGTTKARQNTLKANVYPNPTEDQFHLSYMLNNSNKVEITLVNALGQTVKTLVSDTQSPGLYDFDFSIADLNTGSYLLKIMSGEELSSSKIVKIK